jgi:cytochrome b involved in lipid metabolism
MSEKEIHITINGKLYDMTEFAPIHPGGCSVIQSFAGKDATEVFNMIHGSIPWVEETLQKMEITKTG